MKIKPQDNAVQVYAIAKEIFDITPRLLGEFEDHIKLEDLKGLSIEYMFEHISLADEDYSVTGDYEDDDTRRREEKFDEFLNDLQIKLEEMFGIDL